MSLAPNAFEHVVFPSLPDGAGRLIDFSEPAGRVCASFRDPAPTEDQAFVRWLFQQAGLDSNDYKPAFITRRLSACLRVLRVGSVAEARRAVQRSGMSLRLAMSAMLIGVTSFCRDAAVFDCLRDSILPELASASTARLRVCSVGCSDGAELYSMAMLLAEQGVLGRSILLGTDCRRDAIARAADGIVEADQVRALPPELQSKYFRFDGATWRIHPLLRAAAQWRAQDAIHFADPGPWDMILCRNVSIYLTGTAAAALWCGLSASLRPGGVLVLGKAERPLGGVDLVPFGSCFYRRRQQ